MTNDFSFDTPSEHLKAVLNLPCPSCGAKMSYSAEKRKIACTYCGYTEDVSVANDQVIEAALSRAMEAATDYSPEQIGQKVFSCASCGSKAMIPADKVKIDCPFCASPNLNLEAYQHKYIQPVGIVPFKVPKKQGAELFQNWIKKGWFHPNALRSRASLGELRGIYVPFWTYDAQTDNTYSGQAGHYYYVSQTVMIDGKPQVQQVQKIRWEYRSGSFSHFFDDVLVVASKGIQQKQMKAIQPFNTRECINYDPRLIVGWEAEVYSIDPMEGYRTAEQEMDSFLYAAACQYVGGDTQRDVQVNGQKYNQTFKHVILPVWICSYVFNGKVYQFAINGQTGRVGGDKPLSWVKIVLTVLLVLLLIGTLVYLRESGVLQGN